MADQYEFTVETPSLGTIPFRILSVGDRARLHTVARKYDPLNPEAPSEPSPFASIIAELEVANKSKDIAVANILDDEVLIELWEAYVKARDAFRETLGNNPLKAGA